MICEGLAKLGPNLLDRVRRNVKDSEFIGFFKYFQFATRHFGGLRFIRHLCLASITVEDKQLISPDRLSKSLFYPPLQALHCPFCALLFTVTSPFNASMIRLITQHSRKKLSRSASRHSSASYASLPPFCSTPASGQVTVRNS